MLINTRTSNGLVRLAGLILKLAAIVMVFTMALVLLVASLVTRAMRRSPPIDSRTVDFVRDVNGTWVYPA